MGDDVWAHFQRIEARVSCVECHRPSGRDWHGWRAYRTDDPDQDGPAELTFYCPDCAEREFGPR